MFVVISFIVIFSALLSWAWVKGISNMKENHPDYKGEDFLSTSAGRDLWDEYDEDNAHYEGDF
jgi:hypothetical protein